MSTEKLKYENMINELFEMWKKSRKFKYFVSDGVIDPEVYFSNNVKVLFITKEANDGDDGGDYNLCTEILKHENYKPFIRHMIQWTWAINENFPEEINFCDEIKNKYLRSFAVLNLKKIGGGSISKNHNILQYANRDKDFIIKEIEIIDPDVIIGLISCPILSIIDINPKIKYIEFYHPAYFGFPDQVFMKMLKSLYLNK